MIGLPLGCDEPSALWALLLAAPLVWLASRTRREVSGTRLLTATVARLALLLALVLALAGLTWRQAVEHVGVVFVLDHSASVHPSEQARALDFVRDATRAQRGADLAGVVVFGGDALLETAPTEHLVVDGIESAPSPHQTDLAAGVRLASAVLPSDRAGRIVVLSDGEQTRGDVATQVLLSADEHVEVAVVPLKRATGPEAWVEDVLAPARVDERASFEVRVVARADADASGRVRIYRNDRLLGDVPVAIGAGEARVVGIRQDAEAEGLFRYRAVLEIDGANDTIPQNNEGLVTVQVSGPPRVLYAEGYPDEARHLAAALRSEGLRVDVVGPGEVPPGVAEMRRYAAIVLSDIPAYTLTRRQQEALRAYVRDLGRGLVMVGGDRSFGLGGYYATPVEQALPVDMDIKDKARFPRVSMVMAVDKSCSMGDGAGSKLAMAREAGIHSAALLSDHDELGVIGFDAAASWIVPLGDLTDRGEVTRTIASIRSGGGTDIYAGLHESVDALERSKATLKHAIVLSDGITAPGAFQQLGQRARNGQITISTLAFGSDADRNTMADIAQWGGGNYYLVTDPAQIPAIFTRETMLATRAFLIEEPFVPRRAGASEILAGDLEVPKLYGYVGTEAKARATVPLVTGDEAGAPLLAHWRYGLGRSVAFTSDAKARWSRDWVGTPDYTRFWTQVLRWAVGDSEGGAIETAAEIRDGELLVTVDAFDQDGGFRNFLSGEARVVAPDLTVRNVELRQVAPGRYQAAVPVDQDGSWLVGAAVRQGEDVVGQGVVEAVQPYSPEYRVHGGGDARLAELGRLGGGGVLTSPGAAFARPPRPREVPRPLWPWLVMASTFLLLADVALRRLDWPWRWGTESAPDAIDLLAVSSRRPPPRGPVITAPDSDAPVDAPAEAPPPPPKKPDSDPASYSGRLLAARNKARDRLEDE